MCSSGTMSRWSASPDEFQQCAPAGTSRGRRRNYVIVCNIGGQLRHPQDAQDRIGGTMKQCIRLDVSQKETSVCVVNEVGQVYQADRPPNLP